MNLKKIFLSLLVITTTALFSQIISADATMDKSILKTISVEEFAKMIAQNKNNKNMIILDVRTPAEFQVNHIEGAINIDYYAKDFKASLNKLNKRAKIFIYCRSGNRSGKTLPIMNELLFKEVYDMDGGMNAWLLKKYPVITK